MELTEKKVCNNTIELRINKESFGFQKFLKFKTELNSLGITHEKNTNKNYLLVYLPVNLIFYVEYFNKEIRFHLRSSELILIDNSNKALVETLEIINLKVDDRNIWSKFIRIKSYYLVRKGDVKGYDNTEKNVLLSSVTHKIITKKISVSRIYKKELFENIKLISTRLLFIKSIQNNIEYIIYPHHIKYIKSHSKSKKVILKNNLFTKLIEVKLSKSSESIQDFFADDYNTLFNDGIFFQLNRNIIFNLEIFDEDIFKDVIYKDLFCNKIKMEFLKNLNLL